MKKATLLCEPMPCSPAAETAILPLTWCSESLSSRGSSSPEECFFSQTPARAPARITSGPWAKARARARARTRTRAGGQETSDDHGRESFEPGVLRFSAQFCGGFVENCGDCHLSVEFAENCGDKRRIAENCGAR